MLIGDGVDEPDGPGGYCREIETHLCRRNQGHLIRIVGPAFERVQDWAARGVPLKVALRGIDRYVDRAQAKGARRRPVRAEFCEADVLDVFDEWRRAVGLGGLGGGAADTGEPAGEEHPARHHASLPAHIERVVSRLLLLQEGEKPAFEAVVDAIVRELEPLRASARGLRGEARAAVVGRLTILDAQLLDAARADCDGATLTQMRNEADIELAPFRDRMPIDAYDRAREACVTRLIRERARLPVIAFER